MAADERGAGAARSAWDANVGRRTAALEPSADRALPPPAEVVAEDGAGQVTLRWSRVPGAIGYRLWRGTSMEGPFEQVDHGSRDLLIVPGAPYADTTGERGREAWYAVSSVASAEDAGGERSTAVRGIPFATRPRDGASVSLRVNAARSLGPLPRPWRPVIGSEHFALLRWGPGPGGVPVGDDLAAALGRAARELHVEAVRAHGILLDELGVYQRAGQDASGRLDFAGVDEVYDRLLLIGLRPVVELSFMPGDLAADPSATVFDFRAIISPPRDWAEWEGLVRELVGHLVARYGREEVRRWVFEVWNEPNLAVFWTADQATYFDLYDRTVRAIRSVDSALRVAGPATAAAGWLRPFLDHASAANVPVDLLTTHSYGNAPLDLRELTDAAGRPELPVWWTEWGVSPRHFAPVNDSVLAAPFVARGMKQAMAQADSLAYWVVSDQFVELGGPPRLLHGGFGLLTVGGFAKPRYWALLMLERLPGTQVDVALEGDGAGSLVDAVAATDDDGRLGLVAWNGTLDQSKQDGDPLLDRAVDLEVGGLLPGRFELAHWRVDEGHSNVVRTWERVGRGRDWPDEQAWARLRDADHLERIEPDRVVEVGPDGHLRLAVTLPMPSVSLLELTPESLASR